MELHILKSGLPHDTGHFSCVDGQVSRESIGVESIMNRQSGRCRAGGQLIATNSQINAMNDSIIYTSLERKVGDNITSILVSATIK